jgi:hypothetical protein
VSIPLILFHNCARWRNATVRRSVLVISVGLLIVLFVLAIAFQEPTELALTGPKIEEVKASDAFNLGFERDSAIDIRLFRYTGKYIDCWLQTLEPDGKWVVRQTIDAKKLWAIQKAFAVGFDQAGEKNQSTGEPIVGYLAWACRFGKGEEGVVSELLLTTGEKEGHNTGFGPVRDRILDVQRAVPLATARSASASLVTLGVTCSSGAAAVASSVICRACTEFLENNTSDKSACFAISNPALLPARLDDEIVLLDGVVELTQGGQQLESRIQLKCRPRSQGPVYHPPPIVDWEAWPVLVVVVLATATLAGVLVAVKRLIKKIGQIFA